jgi:hypothetical protein
VTSEEKTSRAVPAKLNLSVADAKLCFKYQFDVMEWDGIRSFQLIFRILKKFNVTDTCDIGSARLFSFLNRVRAAHRQIPFANWHHAIDVFQFTCVLVSAARADRVLSKLELAGLFFAALCHDLGHDGFQRLRDFPAASAYGQLFTSQSVLETEACWATLGIATTDESAVFNSLSAQQQKQIWGYVFDCILATDLARHDALLAAFNAIVDDRFDPENDAAHRLLLMQMLLKCADFGGLARPFEIAQERSKWITEEFYYQGRLSGSCGVVFEDGSRREQVSKQASILGVLRNVARPIFELLARWSSSVGFLMDQATANLNQLEKQRR